LALRERQKRNILATLLLSQGVPMLLAGDEIGRTQGGNNNSYCQDNEISWIDWNLDPRRQSLLEFTRGLIQLFHDHPVLRRRHFFQGRRIRGTGVKDLSWFRHDGKEMTEEDWANAESRTFGLILAGNAVDEIDERGNRIIDDTLLLLLNAGHKPVPFMLPGSTAKTQWQVLLDTREGMARRPRRVTKGAAYNLEARSLALFRQLNGEEMLSSSLARRRGA
jgi:glycogen operon protein